MTYEEYESIITDMIANPNSAPAKVGDLLVNLKGDLDSIVSLNETITKQDADIKELTECNKALCLKAVGTLFGNESLSKQEDEEEDEEEVKPLTIEDIRAQALAATYGSEEGDNNE